MVGTRLPADNDRNTWVQTERRAHEQWANLIARAPMAARLMHVLVAQMGNQNAVVASQGVLGELMASNGKPVHRNTVRNAVKLLEAENWIEVVQLGGKGGALAYVVNDRVAWGQARNNLRYSKFSATVIAGETEQSGDLAAERPKLKQVPHIMRGERQLPTGPGEDPPSQPSLPDFEPDLPTRYDPETGEIYD